MPIVTETSDCYLVLVCLLIVAINQVFARPHHQMSAKMPLELENILQSPCRGSPAQIQSQANIRSLLGIIETQSGIAESFAKKDVEEYVSIFYPCSNINVNFGRKMNIFK